MTANTNDLCFFPLLQLPIRQGKGEEEELSKILQDYRSKGEHYICACLNQNNKTNVRRTPGGLLYIRQWNNMQYVANAAFLLMVYSDHLRETNQMARCERRFVGPEEIFAFAKSQVQFFKLKLNPVQGQIVIIGRYWLY